MTKDYAKKRAKNNRQFNRSTGSKSYASSPMIPGWVWLLSGVALGVGLAIFIIWKWGQFLNKPTPQPTVVITDHTDGAPVEQRIVMEEAEEESKPRFDFYTLLPNLKVDVPDIATPPAVKPPKVAQPENSSNPLAFILQTGSFKTSEQAERLKATLALSGFESTIQTVTIPPDETWYRVYIGPFDTKSDALAMQQNLEQSLSANSLILKIRV